jgi:hypothetical protein
MIAIKVKTRDPIFTWETAGIYRAPNNDMQVLEKTGSPNWSYRKFYKAQHHWG